jgi:ArsR family metal-binding transcriptional regulator
LKSKNLIKKTITVLIDDAGDHISDQSKIHLQQHDFYKTLYSTTNLDCNDESFFNHNIKLTEEQKSYWSPVSNKMPVLSFFWNTCYDSLILKISEASRLIG